MNTSKIIALLAALLLTVAEVLVFGLRRDAAMSRSIRPRPLARSQRAASLPRRCGVKVPTDPSSPADVRRSGVAGTMRATGPFNRGECR